MEQDFQTSFIPKKPMIDSRVVSSRPVSLFMIVSVFIFFAVLLTTGGLYFYKATMVKKIDKMQSDLNLAKNRFEPAKITQLQLLDKRLRASNEILSKHIALSPIFQALQELTLKTVRYTKFTYGVSDDITPKITVKMTGQAVGYRSIALQSDLFTQNQNIIDPIFSNLSLDDKGNVLFNLDFSVDPSFVDYKRMLQSETGSVTPTP